MTGLPREYQVRRGSSTAAAYRVLRDVNQLAARRSPVVDAYRTRAGAYPDDIAGYARDVLGVTLTPQQRQIGEALFRSPYRVLVPSANNQGKTLLGAVVASWMFDSFAPSIVRATAPTARQVTDLLFKELRTIRGRVPGASAGFSPKANRLARSYDHFVEGFTARNADAFQGTHARHLGLLFDEATGIDPDFWRRGATMFGGHAGHWWLCIYNPNDVSSPAYVAEESGLWSVIRLNALEHVNVQAELRGEPPPIPSAIRLDSVLARLLTECEPVTSDPNPLTDFSFPPAAPTPWPGAPGLPPGAWWRPQAPEFEAQVLGRWPLIEAVTLFSPALVDQCRAAARPVSEDWAWQVGCDVARFGSDRTAIAVRRGPCLIHLESLRKRDSNDVAARLVEVLYGLTGSTEAARRALIVIDGTGGYGGAVADRLRGYRVAELNFSAESPDPRILRLRSYLWFRLREFANAGVLDLSRVDARAYAELRADLVGPVYRIDEMGRKVIEPKAQLRSRLGRSPDLADAVALAYHTG